MDEEIWKNIAIKGYEHFEVSNKGRVRNSKTGHIMAIGDNGSGYANCKIKSDGITKTVYVHRLVAEAFLPDWNPDLQVNHKDENKRNNCVENLEMVTDSQNKIHSKISYTMGHIKAQGKTILVFDKDDNFLFEYTGIGQMCREYGFDMRTVQRILSGNNKRKTHHGYKFKYKE